MEAKLWTKDFGFITLVKFGASMVFSMLTTTMTTYAFVAFDAGPGIAGAVLGAFIIGALVSRFVIGGCTDSIGRRNLLLLGALSFLAISFAYRLPLGLFGFMAVRFFHGASFGILSNITAVLAAELIPRDRYGEGIAFFSLSSTLAAVAGPSLGVVVLGLFDYPALFCASSVLSAFALLFALFVDVREVESGAGRPRAYGDGFRLRDCFDRASAPIASLVFVFSACNGCVQGYLQPYAAYAGHGGSIPLFFLAFSMAMLLFRPLLGKAMDRRGDNAAVYPAVASFVLGLLILAFSGSPTGLIVSGVLIGAGYGGVFSCCQAIVTKAAPSERLGVVTSTFYVFADAGQGLGPTLLGSTVPLVGYAGMYGLAAIGVAGAAVAYTLVHGRKVIAGGLSEG